MGIVASGQFEITSWDEKPYYESGGTMKLTRASVTQSYSGDIQGDGAAEYIMVYLEDGTATFVRVERFVGHVSGRFGSFILQGEGTYDGATARGDWSVVPGSATGELSGLTGKGAFSAPHGIIGSYNLGYQLD